MAQHGPQFRDIHINRVAASSGFPAILSKANDLLCGQASSKVTLKSVMQSLQNVIFV
ncbi:MAG: hypothetical protein JWQ50_9297 [Caballeronia mineralivorans]|jgi:hypothetical protein|nr:hypothetical protein [Caballeronia mineralivorans]